MTLEQLEKAGQIHSDIQEVKRVIGIVKNIESQSLGLYNHIGGRYVSLRMCPKDIPQCVLSLVLNSLETKLADLQKQFEEL